MDLTEFLIEVSAIMNIQGYIVIPREDNVEYLEYIGFKYLYNSEELIKLAKQNLDDDAEDIELSTITQAKFILNSVNFAVIDIVI